VGTSWSSVAGLALATMGNLCMPSKQPETEDRQRLFEGEALAAAAQCFLFWISDGSGFSSLPFFTHTHIPSRCVDRVLLPHPAYHTIVSPVFTGWVVVSGCYSSHSRCIVW
jgi:hypothetical protein